MDAQQIEDAGNERDADRMIKACFWSWALAIIIALLNFFFVPATLFNPKLSSSLILFFVFGISFSFASILYVGLTGYVLDEEAKKKQISLQKLDE